MSDSDFYMHQNYDTIFDKNAQITRLYSILLWVMVCVGVLGVSAIVYISKLLYLIEKLSRGVCP